MSIQIQHILQVNVFGFGQGQMDILCKKSSLPDVLRFIENNFPGVESNLNNLEPIQSNRDASVYILPRCAYLDMVGDNQEVLDAEVVVSWMSVTDVECADDLHEFNPQYAEGFQMLSTVTGCNAILWTHSILSVQKDFTWMVIA